MGFLYKLYIQLILPLVYFACGVMRTSVPSLIYMLFFFFYAGWNLSEGLRFGTLIKPILTAIISLGSIIVEIVYYTSQSSFTDTAVDVFGLVAPSSKGIIAGGLSENARLALYFLSDIFALLFSALTIFVIYVHAKNMNAKKEGDENANGETADDSNNNDSDKEEEKDDDKDEKIRFGTHTADDGDEFGEYDESNSIKKLHFVPTLPLWRAVLAVIFASLAASFDPSVLFLPYVVFVVATIIYIAFPRYGRLAYSRINIPRWTTAWGIFITLYILVHMLTAYMYQFPFVSEDDGGIIAQWLGMFKYSKLSGTDYWPLFVGDLCTATLFIIISPSLNSIVKISNAEAARIAHSYSGLTEEVLGISANSFADNSRENSSCSSAVRSPVEFEKSTHSTCSSTRNYALPQTVFDAEKADANIMAAAAAAAKSAKRPKKDLKIAKALYPHGWKIFMILFYILPFMAPGIPMFFLLLIVTISTFLSAYSSALFCPVVLFISLLFTCVQYVFNIKIPGLLTLRYEHANLIDDLSLPLISNQYAGLFFSYQFLLMFFAATYVRFQNLLICVGLYGPSLGSYPLSDMEENEGAEKEEESVFRSENGDAYVEIKKPAKVIVEEMDDDDNDDDVNDDVSNGKDVKGEGNEEENTPSVAADDNAGTTLKSALGLLGIDGEKEKGHPAVVIAEKLDDTLVKAGEMLARFKKRMKMVFAFLFIKLLKYSYILSLIVIYFACLRSTDCLNFIFMLLFLVFISFPKIAIKYWVSLVRYAQFVLHIRYIWQMHWAPSYKEHIVLRIIGLKKSTTSQAIGKVLMWEILVVIFATIQMFFLQVVNRTELDEGDETNRSGDNQSSSSSSSRDEEDAPIKQSLIDKEDGIRSHSGADGDRARKSDTKDVPPYIAMQYRSKNVIQQLYRDIEGRTPDSVNSVVEIIKYGLCTMGLLFCVLAFLVIGILMQVSVISISFVVIAFIIMNFIFYTDNFAPKLRKVWPIFLIWQAIALFACYAYQFKELRTTIPDAYGKSPISKYFALHEWGLYRLRKKYRFVGLLPHILLFLISTVQFSLLKSNKHVKAPRQTSIYKWVTYVSNFICRFVFEYSPFIMYVFAIVVFLNRVTVVHFVLLVFISVSRLHPMGIDGIGGPMMWCAEVLCLFEQLFNTTLFGRLDTETRAVFKWIGFENNETKFNEDNPTEIHTENWSMLYVHIILIVLICIERVTLRWGRREAENVERDHDTPRDIPLLMVLDNYPSKTPEEKTRPIKVINFIDRLPGLLYYQATFTLICICLFIRAKSLISLLYLVAIVVTISVRNFNFRKWVFPFSIIVMVVTFIQYVNIFYYIIIYSII